jgi:hypothetical protein
MRSVGLSALSPVFLALIQVKVEPLTANLRSATVLGSFDYYCQVRGCHANLKLHYIRLEECYTTCKMAKGS